MKIKVTTAPTSEPVTVDYVKTVLRWVDTDSDTESLIEDYITTARRQIEKALDTGIVQQTIEVQINKDEFNDNKIRLPHTPIREVSKLEVVDKEGGSKELTKDSQYYVISGDRAMLLMNYGISSDSFIQVTYSVGFDTIPEEYKTAIAEQVANYFIGTDEAGSVNREIVSKLTDYNGIL